MTRMHSRVTFPKENRFHSVKEWCYKYHFEPDNTHNSEGSLWQFFLNNGMICNLDFWIIYMKTLLQRTQAKIQSWNLTIFPPQVKIFFRVFLLTQSFSSSSVILHCVSLTKFWVGGGYDQNEVWSSRKLMFSRGFNNLKVISRLGLERSQVIFLKRSCFNSMVL